MDGDEWGSDFEAELFAGHASGGIDENGFEEGAALGLGKLKAGGDAVAHLGQVSVVVFGLDKDGTERFGRDDAETGQAVGPESQGLQQPGGFSGPGGAVDEQGTAFAEETVFQEFSWVIVERGFEVADGDGVDWEAGEDLAFDFAEAGKLVKIVKIFGFAMFNGIGKIGASKDCVAGFGGFGGFGKARIAFGVLVVVGSDEQETGGMATAQVFGDGWEITAIHGADRGEASGGMDGSAGGVAFADNQWAVGFFVQRKEAGLDATTVKETFGAVIGDELGGMKLAVGIVEGQREPTGGCVEVGQGDRPVERHAFFGGVRMGVGAWGGIEKGGGSLPGFRGQGGFFCSASSLYFFPSLMKRKPLFGGGF